MIDNYFRALLPHYVTPILKLFATLRFTPNHISLLGFTIAIVAASLVAYGMLIPALLVWWLSRLMDGLDGIYARAYDLSSDFGGFLDIQLDMAAYSALVLALYWQFPEFTWQWLLMLFCYVLCISGALALGSLENQKGMEDDSQRRMRLAAGLAEGGETGIAYSVFLLFPQYLGVTTWAWISVLAITIIARFFLARDELGPD